MRLLRRFYRLSLLGLHIVWGVMLILFALGSDPTKHQERDWRVITTWMKRACKIFGLRVSIKGTPIAAPVFFTSNHISWHDIVVLQSIVGTGFVGKYEIRNWPLLGWLAHHGGTLFIRRGQRDSTQQINQAMRTRFENQQNILVFPEGTTGDGESLLTFRTRLFEPAIDLGIPIQPIAIYYQSRNLSCKELAFIDQETLLGHGLRTLAEPVIDVVVHFGEPIPTAADKHRRELGQLAEQRVAESLQIMRASV